MNGLSLLHLLPALRAALWQACGSLLWSEGAGAGGDWDCGGCGLDRPFGVSAARRALRRKGWAAAVFLVLLCGGALQADEMVFLDGRRLKDEVLGIGPEERLRLKESKEVVEVQGLREILRPVAPLPAEKDPKKIPAVVWVHLLNGSTVKASLVTATKERFTIAWAYGKEWQLPFEMIRAVRFLPAGGGDPAVPEQFRRELEAEEGKEDALLVATKEKVEVVKGGLQEIDGTRVVFVWGDSPRKLALAKVQGIVLARTQAAPGFLGRVCCRLRDGSEIWGKVLGLRGDSLELGLAGEQRVTLSWKEVVSLAVRSDRQVFLSDLQPVDVVQEALVTFSGPWRRDLSVLGRPLTLGKAVSEKGLGVHARCHLAYERPEGFGLFLAQIGIDAETNGKGDCVFRVLGDGKELYSRRMRAADKPESITLPVSGFKRIVLAVDPGEDLDLADHGDWCGARFVKERP